MPRRRTRHPQVFVAKGHMAKHMCIVTLHRIAMAVMAKRLDRTTISPPPEPRSVLHSQLCN